MGDLRELFREPVIAKPLGRLIRCPGCDQVVDSIEVGVIRSMRPDMCGECHVAGLDPEPRIGAAA